MIQRIALRRLARFALILLIAVAASTALATSFSEIENFGGWDTCAACAARGGTGPGVYHTVNYWVSSPSLSGQSAQFYLSGGFPYANAIWWKQLGANSGATHFVYDLYFYINDLYPSQALEFDINQSTGGRRYIFGTQCGVNYDHQWDVWDPAGYAWRPTGIPCNVKPWSWNHVTVQAYRAGGWVHYVSITLNGVTYYVNHDYNSIPNGANDINVAFQMDQRANYVPYSVWLDKVTLNYW